MSFAYARENIKCNKDVVQMAYDVHCIHSHTKEDMNCNNDSLKLRWDYGNKEKGEIHFYILGKMCDISDYEVKLLRYNYSDISVHNITEKEVKLNKGICDKRNTLLVHSSKTVMEENPDTMSSNETKLSSCDQLKMVNFTYVYSSCYILEVQNSANEPCYFSDMICIETNFSQKSVYQQNITVFSQYMEQLHQLQHAVSNFNRLQVKSLTLEVWKNNISITHCNHTRDLVSRQYIVLQSSGAICLDKFNAMPCTLENDRIECSTHNVTDEYYCILVRLQHAPCIYGYNYGVWDGKLHCTFSGEIVSGKRTVTSKEEGKYSHTSINSGAAILIVCSVLLFTAFIAAFTYTLYKKWRHQSKLIDYEQTRPSVVIEVDGKMDPARPQIYLMYSRDCQPFMNVMKMFRSKLKEFLKCEVLDSFDPDCFEDMSRTGTNWPGKIIAKDNVRIVLVETKCAKLHLEAHLEDFKIVYGEPTSWDDYFMHGLKAVMHNPKYNSYHKLFIARIQGFASEEDKLEEITPYIRYDIPEDFYSLLTSISQQFNLTVSSDWKDNIHDLKEAITNLGNCVKDNKDYLDTFLAKKEVNGFRKFI
ncbi:hypothetical protein L9F63_002191 [Diploptera punctata]|uniref:SEFIR domain-containing protein n=1 Tax=Diploptera punctata TaxID=6984 RepID=A0AAD8A2N0_DIPPU|nr:hypothetical protein L9F63_002191 [Diploptera punctata]